MLASRERLDDIRWREEVLGYMVYALRKFEETKDPKWRTLAEEAGAESQRIKASIEAGEWKSRQARRDAHFRNNPHECWMYE
jgi:hypothetical protein